ncbi:hypothetical protein BDV41DRAFT_210303 [Aspergillus transmontanensis]|uniref:Uncharacterized protein n=1 Tax=Aspergillus transmontanensis TaxID=1034304 RepID=A0A5N6W2T2_9EURO|nr:hypothetical protein BDV41DRAFT_210303 [Aspergillus transmontanensis]
MTSTDLSFVSDWIIGSSCIHYAVVCNKSSGYPCLASAVIAAHADFYLIADWTPNGTGQTADDALFSDSRCWSQAATFFLFIFFFSLSFLMCAVMGHRLMQCTISDMFTVSRRKKKKKEEPV